MSNARAASRKPARGQRASSHHGSSSSHKAIHIDEEVKISVNQSLERFRYSDDKELDFPSSLSSTERAFIHRVAQSLGYISKSSGKGSSRFLTIRKKDGSDKPQPAMPLPLSHNSLGLIHGLRQRFPVSRKELSDLQPSSRSSMAAAEPDSSQDRKRASGRLNSGVPLVPPSRIPSELDGFRRCLPVYQHQQEIVQLIRDHRVVLVLGETGSGKTTQIPQFLLDDCRLKGEPCRIFCTQPRRLAAMAVAERVAAERGESVGQTVGYHIRLESRVSPKTLLTFCTSGVFLRTLMSGDDSLRTVTHVIVDEVHERDGLTDFLLTKMRDVLQKIPSLKLILSSAALDIELFLQYFGSCPVIHLKGRQFEVTELFLEDILRLTGFNNNNDVLEYKEETQRKERKQKCLTEWCEAVETSSAGGTQRTAVSAPGVLQDSSCGDGEDRVFNKMSEDGAEQLEPWLQKEMDSCISNIFVDEDQDAFIQLFNLILNESVNVDYTHRETGATPLMVAAGRGFLTQMEQLLNMGADISRKASNGWTALDFAKHFQQTDAEDLLMSSIPLGEVSRLEEAALLQAGAAELSAEEQELLTLYHHSFDDQWVDLDLIMDLLHNICSTSSEGAVLVFLPGYDEIVALRDRVLFDDKRFSSNSDRFQVFTLHSDMQTLDQKKAMKTSPPGVRKIILSTNIAETSITINDVVFVIDSGKVKEKSFDTVSHVSMLKTVWISKASALQRKGRAGRCRPGVCFHLYSRRRFNNMLEYQVPQLLRMPLQELCLQTKLLAPSSCPVADFLSKAPQPPAAHAIRNAVQMLKTIDAMDQYEELTDLGYHLADLPVDPHLGKMVLCAVVLKCLDPILTIACTLAYRDPFVLPTHSSQKRSALHCRKHFTCNTFSDHMALLTAFQGWQKARSDGWGRSFCEKNFLSQATMDMILGMRTQLLGQLRAIGFVQTRAGSDIRDVNLNSENWAVVKAALVAGMYPNLVHLNQKTSLLSSNREKKVHFHPTSTLSQLQVTESSAAKASLALPTDWLIYDEMSRGHRMASVRCCSVVTSISVAIFGGCVKPPGSALHQPAVEKDADSPLEDVSDGEAEDLAEMKVDDWLVFQLDRQVAGLVFELKQRWQNLFIRRMRCPSKSWSQQDEAIIHTLVSVLGAEEQLAGLQQPTGIGQRPKPMSAYEGPRSCVKNSRIPTNDRCFQTSDQSSTNLLRDDLKSSSSSWWRRTVDSPPDTYCPSSSRQPASPRLVSPSARYFIMKSSNIRNLEISQQKGIWSTTPSNETKLTQAFVGNSLIILIFSVQGSGHFQGYARMTSVIRQNSCQDWGGFNGRTGVFSVEWIHKEKLPFQVTQHIMNPWNDNKKVQISRDGQELEAEAGSRLLSLWTS